MSASGNMIPQSRTMMRPSTSMQAQLRPISPSPPRKTTRTGDALGREFAFSGNRVARCNWRAEGCQDFGGLRVEFRRRCAHGQAALSDAQSHGPADRLGGQGVRVLLARLEV